MFYHGMVSLEHTKCNSACFEQVVILSEREEVIDVIDHPNQGEYPGQKIAIVGKERNRLRPGERLNFLYG
jgi:hypothetical protein